MLIEAAKGGHTTVVQLLLDWPGTVLPSPFTTAQMSIADMSALQLAKIPLPTGANLIRPEVRSLISCVLHNISESIWFYSFSSLRLPECHLTCWRHRGSTADLSPPL